MDETLRWRFAYDTISALVVSINGHRTLRVMPEICSSSASAALSNLGNQQPQLPDPGSIMPPSSEDDRRMLGLEYQELSRQSSRAYAQMPIQSLGVSLLPPGLLSQERSSSHITDDFTTVTSGQMYNTPITESGTTPFVSPNERVIHGHRPDLFHQLLQNFYRETFLWIYTNVLLHPGSRRTRNRLVFLATDMGQSLNQVTHNLLAGYLNGFQVSRVAIMQQVDTILSEISSGRQLSPARTICLQQLSVEIGAVLNPRQMLKSFSMVVIEVISRITSQHAASFRQSMSQHQAHSLASSSAGSVQSYSGGNYPMQTLHQHLHDHFVSESSTQGQSWRAIPPPPPPYPSFMLHFLSILESLPTSVTTQETQASFEGTGADSYETFLELSDHLGDVRSSGMSQEDIDQLPIHLYSEPDHSSSQDQNNCVICLCKFNRDQSLRWLPCGHRYHVKCVDRWLKIKGTCPLCRFDVGH